MTNKEMYVHIVSKARVPQTLFLSGMTNNLRVEVVRRSLGMSHYGETQLVDTKWPCAPPIEFE